MIIAYILLGYLVYWIVGCVFLSSIDNKNGDLFQWVKECPFGYGFGVSLWPLIILMFYRRCQNERS